MATQDMKLIFGVIILLISISVIATQVGNIANTLSQDDPYTTEGTKGDTTAFQKLSVICKNWGLHIDQCPSCDCDNCKNQFFKKLTPQAYRLPVLLFTSGLVEEGSGGSLTAEDLSSGSEFCEVCSASGSTFKCAEAAKLLVGSATPHTVDDGSLRSKIEDSTVRNKLVGGDGGTDYVAACAAVCSAIREKSRECETGSQDCASDPTKLP